MEDGSDLFTCPQLPAITEFVIILIIYEPRGEMSEYVESKSILWELNRNVKAMK